MGRDSQAEESVRPRRYHNAVLFAEQAAEKGIKATYWHLLAEEPPWIHQFDRLATAVAAKSGGLPEEVEDALGQLATLSENCRYPSGDEEEPIPADLVSEADAKLAVEQAKRILAWVESLLRTPTGKPKHS